MALNRYRLKHLTSKGHRAARRAAKLMERPDRLIGLILIGNNLVNILASAIATVIAIRLYGDAGIAIATLLLTLVVLIFAEITPKTIAALYPERVAFPFSLILLPLMRVTKPIVWAMNSFTNGILRLVGIRADQGTDESLTQEELRTLVSESGSLIPNRHRKMLVNILDLEEVTVNDIMVPRNEIYGIDLEDSDEIILARLQQSVHTLLPVYRGDINNLEGILHLRDLSRVMGVGPVINRRALMKELQKPYFTPENTPLHNQLRYFQQRKLRLGMIVDEYGDIMGLAALEDILEEIVGKFTSNLIEEQEDLIELDTGKALCSGTVSIRDINRRFGWNLPIDGPKTISGLALEALEAFPDGATSVRVAGYALELNSIEGNLIAEVQITPPSQDFSDDGD